MGIPLAGEKGEDKGGKQHARASLAAQWQRMRLPMQETWIQSCGQEDALEKEMAAHSSILAWEVPWTEEPGTLCLGLQVVGHNLVTKQHQQAKPWKRRSESPGHRDKEYSSGQRRLGRKALWEQHTGLYCERL